MKNLDEFITEKSAYKGQTVFSIDALKIIVSDYNSDLQAENERLLSVLTEIKDAYDDPVGVVNDIWVRNLINNALNPETK